MNVLILSCSTGGGHDAAGRAVAEEMQRRGHAVKMFNPYILKSKHLAKAIDQSYVLTARNVPRAFGIAYKFSDIYRKFPGRSLIYHANRGMNQTMWMYLSANHFDVIITTHFLAAEILTNMRKHGMATPKTVFIATDYACTPFTEETECDAYITPAADLVEDFIRWGVPQEKLYPFGIPVRLCFSVAETQAQVRERLGLAQDKDYVLFTGGSMGVRTMMESIERLDSHLKDRTDVGLIVICGNNKDLYAKLEKKNSPNVTLVGFTDDMASYMKAATVFVTKPGGLSTTEAAVTGVPILHTSAIPGCETLNARYFHSRGMSVDCTKDADPVQEVLSLLNDRQRREEMVRHQHEKINQHSASDICDLAERLAKE